MRSHGPVGVRDYRRKPRLWELYTSSACRLRLPDELLYMLFINCSIMGFRYSQRRIFDKLLYENGRWFASGHTTWLDTSNWLGPALPVRSSHPCPNITVFYGTRGSALAFSLNLTEIACSIKADEVHVNVSYAMPQITIANVSVLSSFQTPLDGSLWPRDSMERSSGFSDFIAVKASAPYDGHGSS